MFLVTYKIKEGDKDYHEYSWFEMGTQSDYDAGVIKDKVLNNFIRWYKACSYQA